MRHGRYAKGPTIAATPNCAPETGGTCGWRKKILEGRQGAVILGKISRMRPDLTLRPYQPDDLPGVLRVFRKTVHLVNRSDYTPAQLEAWAPAAADRARWRGKLAAEEVVVAESQGELVGFCAWTADGCIDFLYVHPAHLRQGVATRLYGAAERALVARGVKRMHTQASITAAPFFLHHGFRTIRSQKVEVRNVGMPNFNMEKMLT